MSDAGRRHMGEEPRTPRDREARSSPLDRAASDDRSEVDANPGLRDADTDRRAGRAGPRSVAGERRLLSRWRSAALQRARTGDWLGAVTWQRAIVLHRSRRPGSAWSSQAESLPSPPASRPAVRRPRPAYRDDLLLILWELERGGWRDALEHIDQTAPRWVARDSARHIAGWLVLARAVAHFQLGAGRRFRRSLATVLWATREVPRAARRERCGSPHPPSRSAENVAVAGSFALGVTALEIAWLYAVWRGQGPRARRLERYLEACGRAPTHVDHGAETAAFTPATTSTSATTSATTSAPTSAPTSASTSTTVAASASASVSGRNVASDPQLWHAESLLLRSLEMTAPWRESGRGVWRRLPELLGGPRALWPFVATLAMPPGSGWARNGETTQSEPSLAPTRPGKRLLAVCQRRAEEDPRQTCPSWLAPALAGVIEPELPMLDAEERRRCEQMLTELSVRTPEAYPRACVLRALAECALWRSEDPEEAGGLRTTVVAAPAAPAATRPEASHARRLQQARTDLGLSAGLFRRLGMLHRAAECEERWSHLLRVRPPSFHSEAASAMPGRADASLAGLSPASGASVPLNDSKPLLRLDDVRRRCAEAGFHTRDTPLLRSLAPLLLIAPKPLPILITGESGTGKEVIARAIHRWSGCRGDFVAIHCGAIPRDLLESELFGHVRGSFTGATADKQGLVEAADGGTLFLDEIGEMSPEAQMKMLRVLETGEVRRVGDLRSRKVAVRLVAATHRDVDEHVARGTFRLDLLHRIRGYTVRLSPLRERPGDVPVLADRVLASAVESAATHPRLSDHALAALLRYDWPGNVRELRSALLRAVYLASGFGAAQIEPEFFGLPSHPCGALGGDEIARILDDRALSAVHPESRDGAVDGLEGPDGLGGLHPISAEDLTRLGLDHVLAGVERRLIERALEASEGNRTWAAKRLGNLSRTTLLSKMKRLGIE